MAIDLKDPGDLAALKRLIARADVLIQNFRLGVIERLGLGYEDVRSINPWLVYGGIYGDGESGPWVDLPGQDLLAQSLSGVTWLNGHKGDGPVPLGLSIADLLAGQALTAGILAALVRRGITSKGAHVQTSLLEVLVDLQFELLTTHLNDGQRPPARADFRNANAYVVAPYGIYATSDGYLALAMMPLAQLAHTLPLPALAGHDARDAFVKRDEIKRLMAAKLAHQPGAHSLGRLRPVDVWGAPRCPTGRVLLKSEAFGLLNKLQTVRCGDSAEVHTMCVPVRIDGERALSTRGTPSAGEHILRLRAEFDS